MATLRLVFFVALLVAVALATPVQKRTLQKRSFIVPRGVKVAPHKRDGLTAMRQVYRKYNFKAGFIDNQKNAKEELGLKTLQAANTTASNRTGTVAANPEPNAALFLSPVDIGGQTVNLDFDTGSSDLWVFSTDLPQAAIGQHTAFDATKSQSFTKMANAQWKISYGDGSGAAGTVGTDRVTIGGVVVEKQTVELANQVSQSFVQDTNTDGLVGLAFSNLNTVNDGVQKTPQKTFFDNVMGDLDQPLFTADLAPDGTGAYEFGRIDQAKFTGDMAWIPVNASSGFWQFQSKAFMVDGQRIENPQGSDAIADTGTSLLLVDQPVADAYYQKVQGAQLNQQVGGYIYPCGATLPDMAVAIGDNYMANIPGSQITFAAVDQANTTCFGGVQGNNGAGLQIFGDTMFKAQFVAFNGGNQSLGFAMKKGVQ